MTGTAGVILAGGRGSRLGNARPKGLVPLAGKPLVEHIRERLPSTLRPLLINANDRAAFSSLGLPVVGDRRPGFAGPLAGLEAAAAWLAEQSRDSQSALAVPSDTPFLPLDLLQRLASPDGQAVRVASHRGRLHPTVALWPLAWLHTIETWLDRTERHSISAFLSTVEHVAVDFPDASDAPGGDPFFNINTPADLALAAEHVAAP